MEPKGLLPCVPNGDIWEVGHEPSDDLLLDDIVPCVPTGALGDDEPVAPFPAGAVALRFGK